MARIVLADDHQIVREGFRKLLEADPECQVVGDAGDGLTALELVERLQPDVLVLDLMMPGLNGLEVLRQARQRRPDLIVIVLSMYANEAYVVEALRHGARAYILKEAGSSDLIHALREALAGRRYLSHPLSDRMIQAYIEKAQVEPDDPYDLLTERERQVFHLAAEGRSNAEIADRLSIGVRTVETHRANLMRKLGLNSHAELIRYAAQRGLTP
jgi:DNA-binding NarL/FixJ family response regulator